MLEQDFSSGNPLDLYSGGARLQSRDTMYPDRPAVAFLSPSRHAEILPHTFQFITDFSLYLSTLYDLRH
jgi:hypothetical protein